MLSLRASSSAAASLAASPRSWTPSDRSAKARYTTPHVAAAATSRASTTARRRGMCRSSTSTMGSIMTATTTAAEPGERPVGRDEHPLHHQREGRHDHGHRGRSRRYSCRSPGLCGSMNATWVPYRAAPHRCSEAYRTYVDEDRPADGDHACRRARERARPEGDEDRSVSVDLAALRRVSDGGRPERTIVDIDTWSFIALAAAALLAAAVFSIVSVADNAHRHRRGCRGGCGAGSGGQPGAAADGHHGAVRWSWWGPGWRQPSPRSSCWWRRPRCARRGLQRPAARDRAGLLHLAHRRRAPAGRGAAGRVERWIEDAPAKVDDRTRASRASGCSAGCSARSSSWSPPWA